MAVPFDAQRTEMKGARFPWSRACNPVVDFSKHFPNGSLVYVPECTAQQRTVWVSRNGVEQPLAAPARAYQSPRLSPDGRRLSRSAGTCGSTIFPGTP